MSVGNSGPLEEVKYKERLVCLDELGCGSVSKVDLTGRFLLEK